MSSKDTKETTTGPQLKENVLALSKKIEAGLTIDKKTGVGSESVDLYEQNLPEGVTMQQVTDVSDYNTTFIAASTHAFGKIAVEAMQSNKKLDSATAEIKMGVKDTLSINVDRSKTYTAQLGDKKGEPITKMGVVTTAYDVRAGKNGGQLKVARALIAQMAADHLK